MKDYHRIFDLPFYQAEHFPQERAFNGVVAEGRRVSVSSQRFNEYVVKLSAALLSRGLHIGDKVGLVSRRNRVEYLIVEMAVLRIGGVIVPLTSALQRTEAVHIMRDADISWLFIDDRKSAARLAPFKTLSDQLKHCFSFDPIDGLLSWEQLLGSVQLSDLDHAQALSDAISPEQLACILYTSGSGMFQKGVMLSHNNVVSNVKGLVSAAPLKPGSVSLSYLPMCYAYERIMTYYYIANGAEWTGSRLKYLADDLLEVRPNLFAAVPELLEHMYKSVLKNGARLNGMEARTFRWAMDIAEKFTYNSYRYPIFKGQVNLARRLVFKDFKAALGDRLDAIAVGGAALRPQLKNIFAAADINVVEGYGLTEAAAVLTFNRFDEEKWRAETVGEPLPNLEVQIARDGEILVKGPNVMMGYYNKPRETERVLQNGWLHTGDLGEWEDKRFLRLIGRKDDTFKTSNGTLVSPAQLGHFFKGSPWIKEILIEGKNRPYLSAIILPNFDFLDGHFKQFNFIQASDHLIIHEEEVKTGFAEEVKRLNKQLRKSLHIERFALVSTPFQQTDAIRDDSGRIGRKQLLAHFRDEISRMY